jgi:hypothetical protein
MSLIASVFAVPTSALPDLQGHLKAGDWKTFWNQLQTFEVSVAYPYSGYVVAVAVEYLRELGIELPVSDDPEMRDLIEQCDAVACTTRPGMIATVSAIAGASVSEAALHACWRDFSGDGNVEAVAAMQAALNWLRDAFAASQGSDWCIILVR